MKKYFDVLRKCRLFREIADEDLIALLGCLGAKVVSFGKKYTIIAEGSPAKYICIMLSGSAQMVRVDYYGNRSIISGIEPSEVKLEIVSGEDIASIADGVITFSGSGIVRIAAYTGDPASPENLIEIRMLHQ